jgi:hypothetical protein
MLHALEFVATLLRLFLRAPRYTSILWSTRLG